MLIDLPRPQNSLATFKIVFLGEGRVGKTSLMLRFVRDQFSETQQTTLQASFMKKSIVIDDQPVNLLLWDTAGQERFHALGLRTIKFSKMHNFALGPIYYRDANGAILVYDITDQDSFTKVKKWVKELREQVGTNVVIAICGNKIDLERQRVVDLRAAEAFAQSVGARHFSTSAKNSRNVAEVFVHVAQEMMRRKAGLPPARPSGSPSPGGVRLAEDDADSPVPLLLTFASAFLVVSLSR